eukprot:1145251-Pelagomonas_calceolata.AAC.4
MLVDVGFALQGEQARMEATIKHENHSVAACDISLWQFPYDWPGVGFRSDLQQAAQIAEL